tara:strand:+ start:94 stop:234 length:141 start_codon:yes stop_codon:yes gene_type:complete
MKKTSSQELLEYLENKISQGDYIDSVHKIKIMTTIEMIKKTLNTEF